MRKFHFAFWFLVGIGWLKLISMYFASPLVIQQYVILFVLAPVLEEFIFRHLVYKLAQKLNLVREIIPFAIVLFAVGHQGNYPFFGWHYSLIVQGFFAFCVWKVYIKSGYYAAVAFHSLFNITIYFLFS